MLRSADAGIGKGVTALLGLPGDAASLAHSVAPQSVIDKVKAIPGAKFLYDHIPGSEALKGTIPKDFSANYNKDADYDPQYASGRYTKAVAAQLPMMATGMGLPAAVAGGVAGQAAYDATGSHLAEAGGNLAGAITAPLALARYGRAYQATQALKDGGAIKAEANAVYANPELKAPTVTPTETRGLAGAMRSELDNAGSPFLPAQAPRVHSAIDQLTERATGKAPELTPTQKLELEMNGRPLPAATPAAPVSIAELHSTRKTLGKIGQETQDFKPTEQAVAAGAAKRVLDQYLATASPELRTAASNWAAQSGAKKVSNLIGNAIDSNASKHSAMNLGNTLRQTFLPLLKNDSAKLRAMGHGDDVIDAVRQVTQGDFLTNALRKSSNMLGGGGGIASTIIGHGLSSGAGGAAGYHEGGLPGMVAGTILGAAPGQLLRMAANSRTLKTAQRVQEQMLSKAPANAGIVARNALAKAANSASYRNAAASNGIPAALSQLRRIYIDGNGS
jgi:hypothetical protein